MCQNIERNVRIVETDERRTQTDLSLDIIFPRNKYFKSIYLIAILVRK